MNGSTYMIYFGISYLVIFVVGCILMYCSQIIDEKIEEWRKKRS